MQSWSAPGQTSLEARTQEKIDAQQKADTELQVQEGPTKSEDAKASQAGEKADAPAVPEVSQEIKGLLGLAYPDLVAVAATACDAWTKGQTEACSLSAVICSIMDKCNLHKLTMYNLSCVRTDLDVRRMTWFNSDALYSCHDCILLPAPAMLHDPRLQLASVVA